MLTGDGGGGRNGGRVGARWRRKRTSKVTTAIGEGLFRFVDTLLEPLKSAAASEAAVRPVLLLDAGRGYTSGGRGRGTGPGGSL